MYDLPSGNFLIKGTDDGENWWIWTADQKEEDVLQVKFSELEVPQLVEAKWDGAGILFPDGVRWTKVTNEILEGYYSDSSHPGLERTIFIAPSKKLTVKVNDDEGNWWYEDLERVDQTLWFSSKAGSSEVFGTWDGTGIIFPDGNKWSKLSEETYVGMYVHSLYPSKEMQISNLGVDDFVLKETEDGKTLWSARAKFKGSFLEVERPEMESFQVKWDGSGLMFPSGEKWVKYSAQPNLDDRVLVELNDIETLFLLDEVENPLEFEPASKARIRNTLRRDENKAHSLVTWSIVVFFSAIWLFIIHSVAGSAISKISGHLHS